MENESGDIGIDEARLLAADPDGLYLFMLEDYPYMMTPDQVAAFTGATGQEIRKLLGRGELQGCRIGVRWLVPKLGLLNYLYRGRPSEEGSSHEEAQMRQAL
ncbi:DNA-binding protein [Gordonibacter sp. 28C]|uniref:helix-turn-helix domain-containing protein n=1 Tax=Gordonibacter sp. 28C TaxID=2078569 RepID=UPI000DF7C0B4|nr:helix-turn-helix domain-containing protein [Gordonibacter sp. 28C]RDB64322.1 DNA-binding protein [Gordonibacter sp. 28C]